MIETSASHITELGNRAQEHLQQGRLSEAVEDYERLCQLSPADPHVWHLLGVAYGSQGDAENAVRCARQTTLLAPGVATGYRNLGHFLLQLGRATEAEASFRMAVSLSAGDAGDHSNLGAALAALGRHDEAIASYQQALALSPWDPAVHFNLAASFHAQSRWIEASRHYEQASQLLPGEPRYLSALATTLRASGQDQQALEAWSRYLRLVPDDLDALYEVVAIYRAYSQLLAAAEALEQAVRVAPEKIEPLMYLGLTQLDLGHNYKAKDCFQEILRIAPGYPQAQYNLALVYERLGLLDEALEAYAQIAPEDHGLDLLGARAGILEKLGEFDAAHALLEPVISAGTAGLRALDTYACLCRHYGECDRAIELIEARLQSGVADKDEQRHLHFRLGELHDRQERYDEAFRHFETGNQLKQIRYNLAEDVRYIDKLTAVLSPDIFTRLRAAAPADDVTPIFIVGMPRSGTTLVEQILASHPDIHAGDELPFIARIASAERDCGGVMLAYPDYLPHLTQTDCDEMARAYLDEIRSLAQGARYVTDKMPHNFVYLGLMHRLFPQAPIIHCQRDPADVCLSCYFQDFASYHNYAYGLADIGGHYRQYQRAMTHYRETLGVPMLEFAYESLVNDPEARSRALIEHCGVAWDERCLRFYEYGRNIKTASYDQVRQPIYKRSAQRWRHYEKHLAPLLRALADDPILTGSI